MARTQKHRIIKISVAPSHSSKVYTAQTLTFREFTELFLILSNYQKKSNSL